MVVKLCTDSPWEGWSFLPQQKLRLKLDKHMLGMIQTRSCDGGDLVSSYLTLWGQRGYFIWGLFYFSTRVKSLDKLNSGCSNFVSAV